VESYAAAGSVAEEVISGIRTVLAFGGQQKESSRYESHLVPAMRSGVRRNFMTGLGNGLMFACLYGGLALGIWFGVQMIIDSRERETHDYTIGTIVIVFWCVSGAGFSIGGAAPHFEAIAVAKATAATVFALIERRPRIDSSAEAGVRPEVVSANIEFRNVEFSYPSRPEVRVLNGFSLSVRSGESVALVGASGCGKSTAIQLLQRFYDPTAGSVLVDGRDVREWNVGFLRQQVGVVGQEPVLFDASIWENIALGSHSKYVDHKDIETALEEANALEFVQRLPQKFETRVGDRGAQLSGGQKQRIAIARALVKAPKVLLLDEATSALDIQSEAVVQTALERAAKGRTTIVVAHRLSTVVNCDRIVVIDGGRVVEMGSHSELMAKEGVYFRLVRKQDVEEEAPPPDGEEVAVATEVPAVDEEEDGEDAVVGDDEEEVLKKFSQRRLLRLFWSDKWFILLGLLLSLLYGLIVPIYAFIFGAFVEVFATEDDPRDIWRRCSPFAFYYVGIAVAVGLISVAQMTALGVAGERLTLRLRKLAFDAILRQEIRWFDRQDNSCGALCARLSADAANVQGVSLVQRSSPLPLTPLSLSLSLVGLGLANGDHLSGVVHFPRVRHLGLRVVVETVARGDALHPLHPRGVGGGRLRRQLGAQGQQTVFGALDESGHRSAVFHPNRRFSTSRTTLLRAIPTDRRLERADGAQEDCPPRAHSRLLAVHCVPLVRRGLPLRRNPSLATKSLFERLLHYHRNPDLRLYDCRPVVGLHVGLPEGEDRGRKHLPTPRPQVQRDYGKCADAAGVQRRRRLLRRSLPLSEPTGSANPERTLAERRERTDRGIGRRFRLRKVHFRPTPRTLLRRVARTHCQYICVLIQSQ
jgi:ABC-type multidrug transport system fused ATPase/permease subunit